VRGRDPTKLAFFTGRDQSQALTGWFAQQYGTPNFAAHGGFCSVNMAAAGLYTFGGSFWEFGEPDWEHTRYFMLFGVAEDHASNPLKTALGKLKAKGVKVVAINPIRTGYGAIADEWIGIRPGTDGLFVAAIIQELFKTEQIDIDYLVRYTNAPWLVIRAPGAPDGSGSAQRRSRRDLARAVGPRNRVIGATGRRSREEVARQFPGNSYTGHKETGSRMDRGLVLVHTPIMVPELAGGAPIRNPSSCRYMIHNSR